VVITTSVGINIDDSPYVAKDRISARFVPTRI